MKIRNKVPHEPSDTQDDGHKPQSANDGDTVIGNAITYIRAENEPKKRPTDKKRDSGLGNRHWMMPKPSGKACKDRLPNL